MALGFSIVICGVEDFIEIISTSYLPIFLIGIENLDYFPIFNIPNLKLFGIESKKLGLEAFSCT
jgi:hypothetical protein